MTLLLVAAAWVARGESGEGLAAEWADSGYVERGPGEEWIETYRANPDYQYTKPESGGLSWWRRFLHRLLGKNVDDAVGDVVVDVLLGIAAGLALWGIVVFIRRKGWRVFARGGRKEWEQGTVEMGKAGERVVTAREWEEAAERGDFLTAVRLRFAALLRGLEERGVIRQDSGKTNRDYYYEIKQPGVAEAFGAVSGAFDRVVYGEFPVDAELYGRIGHLFERVEKEVNS